MRRGELRKCVARAAHARISTRIGKLCINGAPNALRKRARKGAQGARGGGESARIVLKVRAGRELAHRVKQRLLQRPRARLRLAEGRRLRGGRALCKGARAQRKNGVWVRAAQRAMHNLHLRDGAAGQPVRAYARCGHVLRRGHPAQALPTEKDEKGDAIEGIASVQLAQAQAYGVSGGRALGHAPQQVDSHHVHAAFTRAALQLGQYFCLDYMALLHKVAECGREEDAHAGPSAGAASANARSLHG